MERINFNSSKFLEFFDNLSPQNLGILFSIFLHLTIFLFAIGIPSLFTQKNVFVPNIIPIEILNIAETTNTKKTLSDNNVDKKTLPKQKKFNSSDNTEIKKQVKLKENKNNFIEQNEVKIKVQEKTNQSVEEKKIVKLQEKKIIDLKQNTESIKTKTIKPKIKPKPKKIEKTSTSDLQIEPKSKIENKPKEEKVITKPKLKPEQDFDQMLASSLKDLRNEKSNDIIEDEKLEEDINTGEEKKNENMILSISEIDLLRQQLSSCWNAPAGAVINVGDKVTISAKVQQNMKVFENSVRIVDTNISKSNPFYGPITDSAMRTLLNPECTPLKLPKDKYNLWKNLTITFDYSIMKGL